MTTIPDAGRAMLDAPEFATIATVQPDGRPHLSVVWIERDGDDVLVSTIEGRQKYRNVERDPRVTVLVFPKDAPYSYIEIRGTATMTREGGRELIDRLCTAYTGGDRYTGDDGTDNVRVVVRIRPDKVVSR
jgi:PPOX class probable F420-dependent enzyme